MCYVSTKLDLGGHYGTVAVNAALLLKLLRPNLVYTEKLMFAVSINQRPRLQRKDMRDFVCFAFGILDDKKTILDVGYERKGTEWRRLRFFW